MWRKAAIFLLLCPVAVVCAAFQNVPYYGPFSASSIQNVLLGQSGCSTAGTAYSPQSGGCVAPGIGIELFSTPSAQLSTTASQFFSISNPSTTENAVARPMAKTSGVILNCYVNISVPGTSSSYYTFTLRKNGAACGSPSPVSISTQSTSTGHDTTNSCSFVAGDLIDWQTTLTGTPTAAQAFIECQSN